MQKFLMNVFTGSVDEYENWEADAQDSKGREDEWSFQEALNDKILFEVIKDEEGDWVSKDE